MFWTSSYLNRYEKVEFGIVIISFLKIFYNSYFLGGFTKMYEFSRNFKINFLLVFFFEVMQISL